jgi:hypothetical protein
MDLVMSLIRAGLTLGALALILIGIAVFFTVIFMLAASLDKKVSQ